MDSLSDYQWNIHSSLIPSGLKDLPKADNTYGNTSGHYVYSGHYVQAPGTRTTLYSELLEPDGPICFQFYFQLEDGKKQNEIRRNIVV
jgi:hypothetical protein